MPTKVDIVTAEKVVYSDMVDMIVAPGVEGQLGVLPRHTPLMTILEPGEIRLKKGGEEVSLAISGGYLEVRPNRVIILADAAERSEEIDISRAEAARERARKALTERRKPDIEEAEAALRRAVIRLKVAERTDRRKRR